jgi:hypothetical protein
LLGWTTTGRFITAGLSVHTPSIWHTELQPSLLAALPSSHSSTPACTNPSPHLAALHATHASVFTMLASSHDLDPRLHEPVAAHRRLALRGARVGGDHVAVVARLDPRLHEAVAARRVQAGVQARVRVDLIGVVALLDPLLHERRRRSSPACTCSGTRRC